MPTDDRAKLASLPLTVHSVVMASDAVPAGAIFALRAETPSALACLAAGDPLRPYALVHVAPDGSIVTPATSPKRTLDRLKLLAADGTTPNTAAWDRFDKATRNGRNMGDWSALLAAAIANVTGKASERAVASLFSPGGTVTGGGFAGIEDWEVIGWVAILD